jgi:glutathione synthase/RimK-type ligase-like ATP-grasp enzyme
MGSNFSKPYQLQLIRKQGFAIPPTLVTNDPDAARAFRAKHKHVIYKSISSIRSVVRIFGEDDFDRIEHILWCPTQFQAHIKGLNVRVHTIGSMAYGSAIISDAIDYRYAYRDGHSLRMRAIDLPCAVAERCVRLAMSMNLAFAGIDLIVPSWDQLYCLEVNPSPAFAFYERETDQPIARAVAAYLGGQR